MIHDRKKILKTLYPNFQKVFLFFFNICVPKVKYQFSVFCKYFINHYVPTAYFFKFPPQPAITCSKLVIETLEQGVKYVQS